MKQANGLPRFEQSTFKTRVNGGWRKSPLFPELQPYLEAAKEAADGCEFFIRNPRYHSANTNLRTRILRILASAGHKPWPNLLQNLRKSRVTELLEEGYSPQSIASWVGNSVPVMMKHYLIATDADFEAAIKGVRPMAVENGGNRCGNISDRRGTDSVRQNTTESNKKTLEKPGFDGVSGVTDGSGDTLRMGGTELESVTSTMSTSERHYKNAGNPGVNRDDLERLHQCLHQLARDGEASFVSSLARVVFELCGADAIALLVERLAGQLPTSKRSIGDE